MERPPYSVKGDDAENDKKWRKYNREEVAIMRVFAENILGDATEALDLPNLGKLRYSRKAGCSCGCSPGFIAESCVPKAIWVKVEKE
jgi:hypothetical protein